MEIDYDLIPLESAQHEKIARDAQVLARRGKVPPISKYDFGRLAVVNPNRGYSIHHIPDDLRRPLRRMFVPIMEGSRQLAPDLVIERVLEGSEETLHGVLIELHSDFQFVHAVVTRLPEIKRRYPDCPLLLHGELPRMRALLGDLLDEEGTTCELGFHASGDTVTLRSQDDLSRVMVELPKYPTFPELFFDQLRIRLGKNRSECFTPASLKRLYHQFGVGNIDELDVSAKLKNRLITVDLPLSIIESIRFGSERGESFHAVRVEEEKIYSEHFKEKGLLGREIPTTQIQAFYRKLPGREEEEILMERVRAIRINCFEGHISFLWKPSRDFMPLYEVTSLKIHGNGAPAASGAEREERHPLAFDAVVVTEVGRPRFGDVRAGIRRLFLSRVYEKILAKQAKLKGHAGQLKIACLGAMAAQTLNLLKPIGLSRFIPSDKSYYLCDSIDQLPGYHDQANRLAERYELLTTVLRELFSEEGAGAFDPDQINHRLPFVLEWARGEPPPYDQLRAEHLETVYNELRVFIKFSESEFRRIDQTNFDHDAYFLKLFQCNEAAMLAKQIANLKSGAYGQFFAQDESPDFVFFANESDFERNRAEFHLPGMAWSEVLPHSEAETPSPDGDFAFSVFLAEQFSIVNYLWRQEYDEQPGMAYYERYFEDRIGEAKHELEDLRRIGDPEEAKNSPAYQEVHRRLKEEHHDDIAQFRHELDAQALILAGAEQKYFEALGVVNDALGEREMPAEALLGGEDYVETMDRMLAKRSVEILTELKGAIQKMVLLVNRDLHQRREKLKTYLQVFQRMHRAYIPLLAARHRRQAIVRAEAGLIPLIERLNDLAKVSDDDAAQAIENLHARRGVLKEELGQTDDELQSLSSQSQRQVGEVRENLSRILSSITFPDRKEMGDSSSVRVLAGIEERLLQARDELAGIIRGARETEDSRTASMSRLYTRRLEIAGELYASENEVALLEMRGAQSRLQRMMGKKITEPLVSYIPPASLGEENQLEAGYRKGRTEWERVGEQLTAMSALEGYLQDVQTPVSHFQNMQKAYGAFRKAVREKRAKQKSVESISARVEQLTREAEDLPRVIEERFLPSYRIIAKKYLIPNIHERIASTNRALAFIRNAGNLSFENIQRDFLERAVNRRFQLAQFRAGAFYGQNPDHPLFAHLGNVLPAIYAFYRQVRFNLQQGGFEESSISLHKLAAANTEGILRLCDDLLREGGQRRHTYLVLPGTLSLHEALDIIQAKESLFNGIPQLILIFISKFDEGNIRDDAALRGRYFEAVKHNIIINLDSPGMVDNPGSIASRLVQETLGRSIDLDRLQTAPESDSAKLPSEA